jgi:uncharacterized protein
MKTLNDITLDLPDAKRRELAHVVDVIRTGFATAIARRSKPELRSGRLLKIILFGSYARGDWVEDPVGRYFSDFDILVVVNHDDLVDVSEFWGKVEERLLGDLTEGKCLRTQASLIYHSLDDVNEKLRLGRYFFTDILRDGVVLHEEDGHPFVNPGYLTAGEALQETREYFEEWFGSASNFLELASAAISKEMLKEGAFLLHQATERLYHCVFLVRTLYSPKTHNLNRLRTMAEQLEPGLRGIWPKTSRFHKRAYGLLREAYIKARYSREYQIGVDELSWLSSRVSTLQGVVRELSLARMEELEILQRVA